MRRPVGYLTQYPDGLYGERGSYYDYILSSNGIFIEAENALLAARVPVAYAEIRGLAPLEPIIVLRHGLIPSYLLELALRIMHTDLLHELYVGVTWDGGQYELSVPRQESSGARVSYEKRDHTLLELHSHLSMRAFFSVTDDQDEQGFKLFGVIGRLPKPEDHVIDPANMRPAQIRLRVGLYGYFHEIPCEQVFQHGLVHMSALSGNVFAPLLDCFGQEEEEESDVTLGHQLER